MICPECGGEVSVDVTPEFDIDKPWELVCYGCGWFHTDRFETQEDAEEAL